MKLAFDVQFSNDLIGHMARRGHEIVAVAGRGEPDEEWVERALNRGAEIIYSPDLDIPNILDRLQSKVRWLPRPEETT